MVPISDGRNEDTARSGPAGVQSVEEALDAAFSSYSSGDFAESERLCREVLSKVPDQADAMQLLGALLNRRGEYAEAVELFRSALKQAPGHWQLHNNLGMALTRLGKLSEAVSEFKEALSSKPDFAKAHNNLGVALMKLGLFDEAASACSEAIELQGDFKEAYNNLGLVLRKKGELEKAVSAYSKAVGIDSEYAEALSNLGIVLVEQDKLDEAEVNLRKAVELVPDSAEFLNNLGSLFNRRGRFEEAVGASEKAIAIRPDYVEAYNNFGTALMESGRLDEARAAFEKAISIDPEQAEPHHNLSLVLLTIGEFEHGWEEYEWRWGHSGFSTPCRPFSQQRWGDSVEDVGKLLVWGEQGIGDEVQFSGLIREIVSRGVEVIVECDRRLVPLLKRSFPETVIVERSDPPSALLNDVSITHQIPMGSVPGTLGLSPDSMDFQEPFIVADENERGRLRSAYQGDGNALLVGISWSSGNRQEGLKRSIGLEYWGPIFKVAGVRFVSLQYGEHSREVEAANKRFGVEILRDEQVEPLIDLEGFACQTAAMDIVISVDNSTVHFAGALGVKVWTMLATAADWRWGLESESSRWYPSMRLFRQAERGKWGAVISRVAAELDRLANPDEIR